MNKNSGYVTRVKETEEAAMKSKSEVEALKKSKAEELLKLAYALEEIETLKKEVHLSQARWPH